MKKKIAGLFLALLLVSGASAQAAEASVNTFKAAPAVAIEILEEHGVEPTGKILNQVAKAMGSAATFNGVAKDDPSYRHEVMHYLHHDLGVITMDDGECTLCDME